MIAFDNGPADGDYVRYIEAMAKVAATNAVQAASTPMASSASSATGFDDTVQARMRQVAGQRSTSTPTATAAVAKAMAMQNAGNRVRILPGLGRGLAMMLGGVLLVVAGVTLRPTSVIALAAGFVVFYFGFRQASNATAALRDRTGARAP